MKSFAPMPISALTGKIVPLSAFRLLGHLFGLRNLFELRDEFSVTDYELLHGYQDRKSGAELPWCGFSRNTLTKARDKLVELGYIKVQAEPSNTGQSQYRYCLVAGMAILYREEQAHIMTTKASTNDPQYIEESTELNPSPPRDFADSVDQLCQDPEPEPPIAEVSTIDEMVDNISKYYTYYHPYSLPMPNPKVVRAALNTFHRANPQWPLSRMSICIQNIYRSEDSYVNKARSPDVWIKRLPEFSAGPLGDFGHVVHLDSALDGEITTT